MLLFRCRFLKVMNIKSGNENAERKLIKFGTSNNKQGCNVSQPAIRNYAVLHGTLGTATLHPIVIRCRQLALLRIGGVAMAISEDLATDIDIVIAMWCSQRSLTITWENRCALRKMIYDLFVAEGRRAELVETSQQPKVKIYLLTSGSGDDGDEWNVISIHRTKKVRNEQKKNMKFRENVEMGVYTTIMLRLKNGMLKNKMSGRIRGIEQHPTGKCRTLKRQQFAVTL